MKISGGGGGGVMVSCMVQATGMRRTSVMFYDILCSWQNGKEDAKTMRREEPRKEGA